MNLITAGGGTGYKHYIRSSPPWNRGYKNSSVIVTYKSKLGFGNAESNVFPILFTKKEQKFTIPIAILTDDYDESEDKDGPVNTPLSKLFQYDFNIDKTNKIYNVSISLKPNIGEWTKDFPYVMFLSWNNNVNLVEIRASIDLQF